MIEELDLVEEDDQFTHMIRLDGEYKEEMMLNVFKKDEDFLKNEKQYEDIKCEILGESDASDSDSSGMVLQLLYNSFSIGYVKPQKQARRIAPTTILTAMLIQRQQRWRRQRRQLIQKEQLLSSTELKSIQSSFVKQSI